MTRPPPGNISGLNGIMTGPSRDHRWQNSCGTR